MKSEKIQTMIYLSTFFFLLELIFGYISGSIALIADSFHMLSDVASLFIALYAHRLAKSKEERPQYSYGLQRAEVLGALINGVSLLALCLTLIIEALQRFVSPHPIEKPWMVLYVACAGITVNIIGMFLFHGHSHAHGHDHHEIIEAEEEIESIAYNYDMVRIADQIYNQEQQIQQSLEEGSAHSRTASASSPPTEASPLVPAGNHSHGNEHHHHHHADLNMHGLFIHILGDLLASIGVIASTCIIIFVDKPWTIYLDPIMSMVITFIVIGSTIPLVKSASYILLQGTPSSISIERIRKEILKLPNVIDVHELHVWQLSEGQTIGSIHIVVPRSINHVAFSSEQYMELATTIKKKLHRYGIHSTTIQPEYRNVETPVQQEVKDSDSHCLLPCVSEACEPKLCCPKNNSE